MQTSTNPFGSYGSLVDREIGTAFEVVKAVSGKLVELQHISENLPAIYQVAQSLELMAAFVNDPTFLPWLQANEDTLGDLATLLASLTATYPSMAADVDNRFLGWTALGENGPMMKTKLVIGLTGAPESTVSLPHELIKRSIMSMPIMIACADGTRRPGGEAVKGWVNDTHLFVETAGSLVEGVSYMAVRPFSMFISYLDVDTVLDVV